MLRVLMIAATAVLVGCPTAAPIHSQAPTPPHADDDALRIRIARAEARRGAGLDELIELASRSDPHARPLALRGLGRIGGPRAAVVLEVATTDTDDAVAVAAIEAIGIAAALDDTARPAGAVLLDALAASRPRQLAAIEALGRAGDDTHHATLAKLVAGGDRELATAAALALGRHGRRKIALAVVARDALAALAGTANGPAKYAAVYALAREFRAGAWPHERVDPARDALAAAVTDDDPEIRATAIAGLVHRDQLAAGRKDIEDSLRDRDWRVAVEAVRALAGDRGDREGRAAVANALARRWRELEHENEPEAHVIIEGLRTLLKHELDPPIAATVTALGVTVRSSGASTALVRGWISCLAELAASHRAGNTEPFPRCDRDGLPDHLRLPLLGDLVTAGAGTVTTRRDALRALLEHDDARVRAAGLGALPATWKDGDAGDQHTIVATLAAALASRDPIIAGAAVDAVSTVYDDAGPGPERAVLDNAVAARALAEHDVELGASLLELIGTHAIAAGAAACHAAIAGHPVRVRAAVKCLAQLGEPVEPPPIGTGDLPHSIDVGDVIGRDLSWHLVTSRGEIVVHLRPDLAPWNVAAIVELTRRGFYDGLELHRVVPNFVAQGGDPTMSGWGGPGFTTPAEPSLDLDGPGFSAGGIGIADAGRDSGGSQWFVMHSRAPHLDGRYTWIGAVVAGQKSADALVIGDRVERAQIIETAASVVVSARYAK